MILNLTEREKEVLYFTITEYLKKGTPIASKTIAQKYLVKISAPTIRNIMSKLEGKGLLYQPHTSAGRVPTDKGLSYFINELMVPEKLDSKELVSIKQKFYNVKKDSTNFWEKFGEFISELTGQIVVIISPSSHQLTLKQIKFVPLEEKKLLVVMLTSSGQILHKLIEIEFEITNSELEYIHNYLNSIIKNKTLSELKEALKIEIAYYSKISASWLFKALKLGNKAVKEINDPRIIVEGFRNLVSQLSLEEKSIIKGIISTIEQKEAILSLIDKIIDKGVVVYVGNECPLEFLNSFSLIMTNYTAQKQYLGTATIIGLKWMNYPRIIPILNYTRTLFSGSIEEAF